MASKTIPPAFRGWWRIMETSAWGDDVLELLGPALISLTGEDDRLRMCALLARVKCMPTNGGVAFMWQGAWEFDQLTGSGNVEMGKDGRLHGEFQIDNGDDCTFVAERTVAPDDPIDDPPSYRDKWRRRR